MFSGLRSRLTYANVMSSIAVFLALGGGAAYASHLVVRSSDIVNNEVQTADVRDDTLTGGGLLSADIRNQGIRNDDIALNTITGGRVADHSLRGRDIAKTQTRLTKDFGTVSANSCHAVTAGVPANSDDHVVVTPDYDTTQFHLEYTAQVNSSGVLISACNPTNAGIAEGNATFNVLVIDP